MSGGVSPILLEALLNKDEHQMQGQRNHPIC